MVTARWIMSRRLRAYAYAQLLATVAATVGWLIGLPTLVAMPESSYLVMLTFTAIMSAVVVADLVLDAIARRIEARRLAALTEQ